MARYTFREKHMSSKSSLQLDIGPLPVANIPKAAPGDCNEYYFRYINLVPSSTAGAVMVKQIEQMQQLFGGLSQNASMSITPPWTWSLRQVLGHLCDGERVFGYRAARLAANDPTPLPGFDQNVIVDGMNYQAVPIDVLLNEWLGLRLSNIMLFAHLRPEQFKNQGTVDDKPMNVTAAANIIVGHIEHHLAIIRKRIG